MKKTTNNSHNVWEKLQTALHDASDDQLNHADMLIRKEQWIRHWYKKFSEINGAVKYFAGGYTVVIILPKSRTCAPRGGWSTCNPCDTFDQRTGIAVATARAFGADIPDFL